jgi:AraC-like DNA-binding protein
MSPNSTNSPKTCATTLRLFVEALDRLGADSASVLRASDIDPALLLDPEARIPQDRIERVWPTAQEVTGDPCIGLHAGAQVHPHAVNLFGYLILSSATVGDGLRRVARFQGALTDVPWLAAEDAGSSVRVRVGLQRARPEAQAIHAEYIAALIPQVLSWVSESQIDPLEVSFTHEARGALSEYQRILRCPVEFSAERNELLLSSDMLERPSMHANVRVAKLHDDFARELLAQADGSSLAGRVRRALAEQLESGPSDLSSVARKLAMSPRNVQRRLADERTTFRELLDSLRRDLARHHLERPHIPIAEVAYLTGFSEASAFTRAVRRWFDCSPAQLRRLSG